MADLRPPPSLQHAREHETLFGNGLLWSHEELKPHLRCPLSPPIQLPVAQVRGIDAVGSLIPPRHACMPWNQYSKQLKLRFGSLKGLGAS
jgi:hypothetical protein